MGESKNPWPENSDYGKLWRKGYQAGQSDTTFKLLPAIEKLVARSTQDSRDG